MSLTIWSIGHSTHPFEQFVGLLRKHMISLVADVRTVPKSRRHPQFQTDSLARTLPAAGINYRHLSALGGWRKTDPDSPNGAWRNGSFRGYADYAMSDEFRAGLVELRELALRERVALMCSEALWWRCHRRIISDYLVVGGDVVEHIGSDGCTTRHQLTSFASLSPDGGITYPASEAIN